ncbi:sugar O-acyltransferase (sialic acid O-acetyltransferase NeuD family) [Paenibacillus turicensis]|uniref:Sugar O-acyltransferase (Sialic acid O-acetyltransferase NeuD family) n=1 Tax=Paenibacillus turicensis TaxID=160487 RepID=A0ABS4FXB9_9BACL|nr:acetyltransferase [Paenibacillus turicensis]MBP1907219.1 sugar O-acyltransferase (sialic acid O-acetyltransferase NeuD family) [Paenibacillus turicensis]
MNHKKTIIFGNTRFAMLIKYYLESELNENVACLTVNRSFINNQYLNTKIVPFEDLTSFYPPEEYKILPVIGYNKMNEIRYRIHQDIKLKGYEISSFIHPSAFIAENVEKGEGNIFLEQTLVQPFVTIGDGNIFWSKVNISHHAKIGNFNFFAPSVSVSGDVSIQDKCFFGNNCTIKNSVSISSYTLIGAGSYVSEHTDEFSTIVPIKSQKLFNKKSIDIKLL